MEKKAGIDHWETLGLLQHAREELPEDLWAGAEIHTDHLPELDKAPEPGAQFDPLPGVLARAKSYTDFSKGLKNHLYREHKLTAWSCPEAQGVFPGRGIAA